MKGGDKSGLAGTGANGKDFTAGFGNQYFMLPLGGQRTVFSNGRPTVGEHAQVAFALIDHRFDSKDHAGFQFGTFKVGADGIATLGSARIPLSLATRNALVEADQGNITIGFRPEALEIVPEQENSIPIKI